MIQYREPIHATQPEDDIEGPGTLLVQSLEDNHFGMRAFTHPGELTELVPVPFESVSIETGYLAYHLKTKPAYAVGRVVALPEGARIPDHVDRIWLLGPLLTQGANQTRRAVGVVVCWSPKNEGEVGFLVGQEMVQVIARYELDKDKVRLVPLELQDVATPYLRVGATTAHDPQTKKTYTIQHPRSGKELPAWRVV